MPELPEVEVLRRHLDPLLTGRRIRAVEVRTPKLIRPGTVAGFESALTGMRFQKLDRRGKYLVFTLTGEQGGPALTLLGHLGMAGRLYLQRPSASPAKHVAVLFELGRCRLVFEDPRRFGRLTLDTRPLAKLGPEPLDDEYGPEALARGLGRSAQPVKVRLLDQSVVAGVGNIYASEALFRAGIPPRTPCRRLGTARMVRLHAAVRTVLTEAIQFGSTVPLDWDREGPGDGLFYYGRSPGAAGSYEERLAVYGRDGEACRICDCPIRRSVLAGRSTFHCPQCQRG